MKRYKRILILLGVLAVACAATFAVSRYEEYKEEIANSDEVILEIPTDSVTTRSWTIGDETLAFHKDDVWYYDADETFPVDETAISTLLEGFQSFGVSFIIEEVEDYGQYGLDDPERIFELLELREKELKEDLKVLLERGEAVPRDAALITGFSDLAPLLKRKETIVFTPFPKRIKGIENFDRIINVASRQMISFAGNLTLLESELKNYARKGYEITLVFNSQGRRENMQDFVARLELKAPVSFAKGELTSGMDFPDEKKCWICG